MNKLLITMGVCLSTFSTAYAQSSSQHRTIHDHFKQVIEQKPYHVEVCRNVSMSGDKSGDMLKGAIIGGIIGNNVGNVENGGAIGAILGGMLGHNNSNKTAGTQRQCKTELRWKEEKRTILKNVFMYQLVDQQKKLKKY